MTDENTLERVSDLCDKLSEAHAQLTNGADKNDLSHGAEVGRSRYGIDYLVVRGEGLSYAVRLL